jgi:hypothetical protein
MAVKITPDGTASTDAVELTVLHPLSDYDLEKVTAGVPREVDPMLASQGFKLDFLASPLDEPSAETGKSYAERLVSVVVSVRSTNRCPALPCVWSRRPQPAYVMGEKILPSAGPPLGSVQNDSNRPAQVRRARPEPRRGGVCASTDSPCEVWTGVS